MKNALIILAPGFEEIEAVTPMDILRRAKIDLTSAGLGSKKVKGAHNITFETDILLDEYSGTPDALILPGGMPGTLNLMESEKVIETVKNTFSAGGLCCAICAAARVLNKARILDNKNFTCYPGHEQYIDNGHFTKDIIVKDGNVLTSRGPGTAMSFALEIVKQLLGEEAATGLSEKLLYKNPLGK